MNIENTARTINVIPAIHRVDKIEKKVNYAKPRVCAYARVSTDSEDQLNSYETQCQFYNEKLSSDPNVVYMGLYADPGITGTKMRKRKNFLKMIEDCRSGKITRIITKSVQRFARNTVECLALARELQDIGVTIKFETSGIDTADPNSWLILGIMATIAEEESRTISHNITWSHQKKFERGEYVGSGRLYGYKIKDNVFTIIEDEAMVVRKIYDYYMSGETFRSIKKLLEKEGIPSPLGKSSWAVPTIRSILTNEKYKGELLLQKTYKADILCERKRNDGAKPQYLVKNNHLPIIAQEVFNAVQVEIRKREERQEEDNGLGNYTNDYAFSSLIECGECGAKFRRHSQWSLDYSKKVPIWVCTKHQKLHNECQMRPIKESSLEQGFVEALQLLTSRRTDILSKIKQNINTIIETPNLTTLESLVRQLEKSRKELLELSVSATKPSIEQQENSIKLINEIKDLQEKIEIAKRNTDSISILEYRLTEIRKVLNGTYNEFNKELCKALIEKIVIKDKHTATYVFKCGIALEQTI